MWTTPSTNNPNGDESNCVCGNGLDFMDDPLCAVCATNLESIHEK